MKDPDYAEPVLLDLYESSRVIGLVREPLAQPNTHYGIDSFRGNVTLPAARFPKTRARWKLYPGAADTSMALASAPLADLRARCESYTSRAAELGCTLCRLQRWLV